MGVTYHISTWFPLNYPEANRKYPVIYLLDGEWFMGLVSGIVGGLIWGQVIPECLIVGVGHDVNTLDEWWQPRSGFEPSGKPRCGLSRMDATLQSEKGGGFSAFS